MASLLAVRQPSFAADWRAKATVADLDSIKASAPTSKTLDRRNASHRSRTQPISQRVPGIGRWHAAKLSAQGFVVTAIRSNLAEKAVDAPNCCCLYVAKYRCHEKTRGSTVGFHSSALHVLAAEVSWL
jgi:hypothetical protein